MHVVSKVFSTAIFALLVTALVIGSYLKIDNALLKWSPNATAPLAAD